ncbi:thiol reductant ABC exporter subunit CydD [Streptomyces sp. HNM0575]|uniref:thiol reductant ABC exporter subunit CydD n=1 Tax=Streptomyces sp. HNM0575 TaxID=2716338 RepID=UPI00145E3E9E|nr:thiol reductant ABC exporter subunit CydD [Streptomyces sp. HNM0575]NLU76283.1 thiol reductant ABC exporter subunit CydD [Streptomyces sp. HNM0575]
MRPVDPRLLTYARTTRVFLAASVLLGLLSALLVIGQAVLIADVVVRAFRQDGGVGGELLLLAAIACGRALVSWLTELAAHRSSAAVKSELRTRLTDHALALGPAWLRGRPTGELAALATRGIDALDGYFARYLPQLALAVAVPAAVLVRIVTADWVSAAVIAVTLPLVPLFMALVGWATQTHMDRQWRLLTRLSGHFLDVVAGLPTLKVFGRAKAQARSIRAITGDYRRATLRTLRVAFLSSLVLELVATVSVALVAVGIGMRLVHGELDLYTGLLVLVLAPEAYLPLRQVGTHYHAAAEGLSAAAEVFAVLAEPAPPAGGVPAPDLRTATVTVDGLRVRHEGRAHDSLPATGLTLRPGETVALTGPSGAGKSTLLHAMLGFARPASGAVRVDGTDLRDVELASWHAQIAWVPQHPHLFAGTVADNVRLARPGAGGAEVAAALADAGADLDPATVLGEGGEGISAGQRRRVALARAFLTERPLLLLDEPTAALDGETEASVAGTLRRHRLSRDRTVLLVTHRPGLLAAVDRVVELPAPPGAGASGPVDSGPVDSGPVCSSPVCGAGVERVGGRAAAETVREGGAERAHGPGAEGAEPSPGPPSGVSDSSGAFDPSGVRGAVRDRGVRRLTAAAVLGSLALLSAVGLMATSGWLISRASQQPPVLYLMVAVTATRTFGIGRAVFRYAERLVSHDAVLRLLADVRVRVYRRLERLAPAALRRTHSGDLLTRLVADVDALQDRYLRWLLPAVVAAVTAAAAVAFTAALLPSAGAVLAAGLLFAGVAVPLVTGFLSRRTERRLAPSRALLTTRVVDLLTGADELTVAGALPERKASARAADRTLTRLAARSSAATAAGSGLTALACGLTVTAAAWAGTAAVHAGRLDGVWLAAVVLVPLTAFEAVGGMPQAVQFRQRARRSAERVREVLEAPEPVREPARPVRGPASPFPLRLRGVSVRYPEPVRSAGAGAGAGSGLGLGAGAGAGTGTGAGPERGVGTGRPTPPLADFDLTLTPARRVAVVGASGSGKTTLARTLLRFLDAESGTYTLGGGPDRGPDRSGDSGPNGAGGGGVRAADLDSDTVRRHVGLCAQDAHIFDSTLRENLLLARKDATDGDLRRALAAARLDAWTDSLPEGLETLVGEHGARLSGGERQRLALARALLADFPVLVLDEPAEHLDLPTADALTADLLAATEGRTTVLITHRLKGLEAVDEVIVLDAGRTVERGAYAELAAAGGPFSRMLAREAASGGPRHPEPDGRRSPDANRDPDRDPDRDRDRDRDRDQDRRRERPERAASAYGRRRADAPAAR